MNWDAIGGIGEIVGATAVVVTLAYLAVQIKHSTKLAQSNAHERSVENWLTANNPLLEPNIAELFSEGCKNYQGLSLNDRIRFDTLIGNMLLNFEAAIEKKKLGFASDEFLATYERYFAALFKHPGVKEYFKENRPFYTESFSKFIDRFDA